MSRRGHLTVAGIALVLGVLCLAWGRAQAPGAWLVRGYLGDVVIVIFLVAGLGAVGSLALITRLALVLAVAGGLEFFQLWHHQRGVAGVSLGTTFDPYDLAAYSLGAMLAWAQERRCALHQSPGMG
jgi:Protein of unknown function (DUF2809)